MIAVDTSALMAIVLHEPERASYLNVLTQADKVSISAATMTETLIVCFRRGGGELVAAVESLIDTLGIGIEPYSSEDIALAHAAFVQYGKGSGHPAQLNFGDLFAYALAKARGVPLLFKGDDFGHTDVDRALSVSPQDP
jgi:ribonuclease VapC